MAHDWNSASGYIEYKMEMNAYYHLKNIRKKTAYEETCLSASIWHGDEKIGDFHDCPDSGKPIFHFNGAGERIEFEDYIRSWWAELDQVLLCNLRLYELVDKNVMREVPIGTKMRCWIALEAGIVEMDASWKWKSRTAKRLMHSFQSYRPSSAR
jgi:hypothetical protein